MTAVLQQGDGLLIVDVQVDFCPGGALPVPNGDHVVPVLNEWIDAATRQRARVYASRDWHPLGHPSFRAAGGEWPPHCLQNTPGAAFHPDLALPADVVLVAKGTRFDKDQLSAFDDTGLDRRVRRDRVRRLWIGGLALDVCVRATALDARRLGFAAALIPGASRAVTPGRAHAVLDELSAAGVVIDRQAKA